MGMGYVGLPLALAAIKAGFRVIGLDTDERRVAQLNAGDSGIKHVPGNAIVDALKAGKFRATADFSELPVPDAILIAVPTPLSRHREPDLSYVENSTRAIATRRCGRPARRARIDDLARHHRRGDAADPGGGSGLKSGRDFYPGLLAGARGSRQPGLRHLDDPEGRRRRRGDALAIWSARSTAGLSSRSCRSRRLRRRRPSS